MDAFNTKLNVKEDRKVKPLFTDFELRNNGYVYNVWGFVA
ncbi:MAG: hypothetical protein UX94_C0005G0023 [Parcubacteria group bacterium GW2011_GWA2_47_21]|nr:MAG: hypothetical protein UX94_C0005G0023 [Parcubacteria group bacterium GW2011_GWA2_47_21]